MKDLIVLIPSRGGSVRMKHKNMYPFQSRPLLWYSIEFAKRLGFGKQTYVSSDCDEILEYAKGNNVNVLRRPESISASNSKISDVLIHLVNYLKNSGIPCDYILLLQPTNPLRNVKIFKAMSKLIREIQVDCIFTAVKSHEKIGKFDGEQFIPYNYSFENQSHHENQYLCENGTMYLFKTEALLDTGSLFGSKAVPYQIDDVYRYNDINEELDLRICEMVYKKYKNQLELIGDDFSARRLVASEKSELCDCINHQLTCE